MTAPISRPTSAASAAPEGFLDTLLFWGLLALILLVPVPFASARNWAMALWSLVVVAMLCIKLLHCAMSDRGYSAMYKQRWPLGLLCALALLQWVQIAPLGWTQETTVSGAVWGIITRDVHQSTMWLLLTITYSGVFALVGLLARTRARVRLLMYTIVASGLFQALLAITLVSIEYTSQLLFFELKHVNALGTFGGRNIFAGYLELCLSVGVALLVASMARQRLSGAQQQGWKAGVTAVLSFLLSGKMILRGILVVMVIALVLTRSRMGNIAFFASLVLGGVIVAVIRQELRKTALVVVASMLLIDLIVIGQWVGVDKVMERISETTVMKAEAGNGVGNDNDSLQDRAEASRQALPMIQERPWLGFGAGTFYTSFLPYQNPNLKEFWNHPHNDFVEIAVDTGLLGLGLLVVLSLSTAWRAWGYLRGPFNEQRFAVGLACWLSLICIGIHGFFDFLLQIPANAMLLCVVFSLVWSGDNLRRQEPITGDANKLD